MWELNDPAAVKLIVGILAANRQCLDEAVDMIEAKFGALDLKSPEWAFDSTEYYRKETGSRILRQFVTARELIEPGLIGKIKHMTNAMEKKLAAKAGLPLARPVNLDPGYIEPSKLVLATTKNFSHRVYIGGQMWAEVTLLYQKGWQSLPFTFPDYRQASYHVFFDQVRERLVAQLRGTGKVRRRVGVFGRLK